MLPTFVVLSVVLNFIVQVYCKDFYRQEILATSVKEEPDFDSLARVETHEKEDEVFVKPKPNRIVRKNFIPLEDLQKLKRIRTLKDFRREFGIPMKGNYLLRRGMNDGKAQQFENAYCKPRLTAVEIPAPAHGLYFPDFILLHRCAGGCYFVRSDIMHCEATKTEKINVGVMYLDYSRARKRGLPWEEKRSNVNAQQSNIVVSMVNHTQCDCKCVVKASDCDNATEIYDGKNCRCKCRDLKCDASYKVWDSENCRCKCKNTPTTCSSNKLWSPDTCQCECLKSIKKRCIRKNKLLNKKTCSCYCSPDITCPAGKKLDNYDCSCV